MRAAAVRGAEGGAVLTGLELDDCREGGETCRQHDAQPQGQPQREGIHRGLKISSHGLEISFYGLEIGFCDQLAHHELPRCLRMRFGLPLAYPGIP